MTRLDRITTVRWYTTPAELRKVAADMTALWTRALGGEDLTVFSTMHERPIGEAIELQIIVDQDRIRREIPS